MDFLYAKINKRTVRHEGLAYDFAELIAGRPAFPVLSSIKGVDFSVGYRLDENEWFSVNDFSKRRYFPKYIEKISMDTTVVPSVNFKVTPENIEYLMAFQDERYFLFQKTLKSRMVKKSRIIVLADPEIREVRNGIFLNDESDAIYDMNVDTLYFKNVQRVNIFFPGIISIYREASQEEIDDFIESSPIELSGGFATMNIGTENRRRIAVLYDRRENLDADETSRLFSYLSKYIPSQTTEEGKLTAKNDSELRNILYGLDERYYETEVTGEKRVANSVRTV